MENGQSIITLCWIVQGIYWIVGAANVRAEHKEIVTKKDLWHYLLLFLAFILLNFDHTGSVFNKVAYQSVLIRSLAVVVVIAGLTLSIWSRAILASNWTASVEFFKGNKLIKNGPYKLIRHPIYAGFSLMFLGTMLHLGTFSAIVGSILFLITVRVMLYKEERFLIKQFGQQYLEYQKKTKLLIPFLI